MASSCVGKDFFKFHLVFVFSSVFCLQGVSASAEEAAALLNWKATLQNPNKTVLATWNFQATNASNSSDLPSSGASPCTWYGVSCINGSVNKLNLSDSSINGTLYNFPFTSLPNLEYVDLAVNGLSGTIPPQISNLSKLIYLDLQFNQLFNEIPHEIGLLTNLETLHLNNNQFNGSILEVLGKLRSLIDLALSTNYFEGSIPSSFGNLENLTYLYLSDNQLSGPIPPDLEIFIILSLPTCKQTSLQVQSHLLLVT